MSAPYGLSSKARLWGGWAEGAPEYATWQPRQRERAMVQAGTPCVRCDGQVLGESCVQCGAEKFGVPYEGCWASSPQPYLLIWDTQSLAETAAHVISRSREYIPGNYRKSKERAEWAERQERMRKAVSDKHSLPLETWARVSVRPPRQAPTQAEAVQPLPALMTLQAVKGLVSYICAFDRSRNRRDVYETYFERSSTSEWVLKQDTDIDVVLDACAAREEARILRDVMLPRSLR